jgi:hypothetical protein
MSGIRGRGLTKAKPRLDIVADDTFVATLCSGLMEVSIVDPLGYTLSIKKITIRLLILTFSYRLLSARIVDYALELGHLIFSS